MPWTSVSTFPLPLSASALLVKPRCLQHFHMHDLNTMHSCKRGVHSSPHQPQRTFLYRISKCGQGLLGGWRRTVSQARAGSPTFGDPIVVLPCTETDLCHVGLQILARHHLEFVGAGPQVHLQYPGRLVSKVWVCLGSARGPQGGISVIDNSRRCLHKSKPASELKVCLANLNAMTPATSSSDLRCYIPLSMGRDLRTSQCNPISFSSPCHF